MQSRLLIQYLCANIDEQIQAGLDGLLHYPPFQKLEANWRALHDLLNSTRLNSIKFKILSLSYKEIQHELLHNTGNRLQTLIYSYEFDQAGGEPFGLMLVNHPLERSNRLIWQTLAKTAAQSFCTCLIPISSASLNDHSEHELDWKNFQHSYEAGFLGAFIGRILAREPYQLSAQHKVVYQESSSRLLFKESVWLYAEAVARSFTQVGWFYDLNHPLSIPHSAKGGICEVLYYGNQKIQANKAYCNYIIENLSCKQLYFNSHKTQYLNPKEIGIQDLSTALCFSRIAHYLKVILRDKLTLLGKELCENYLQNWLQNYCSMPNDALSDLNYAYPLETVRLKIEELKPGNLKCVVELKLNNHHRATTPHLLLKSEIQA